MTNVLSCSPASETSAIVRYNVEDRFTVAPTHSPEDICDVWSPIIQDSPIQRVLSMALDAPGPYALTRDPDHGNRMLHAQLQGNRAASFTVRYTVERRRLKPILEPACVGTLETPVLFHRELAAERCVDVNETTRALAHDIVGAERNVLEQARRIYDHVVGAMTYNAAQQSWTGSTAHALACSVGNCNDIHALFISLCRSTGIPARLVLGQAFEPPPPGEEACDLCGYHCWAESFVPGLGWLPADASCACKYGKGHLFGDLEMNHVAWSTGRDILLTPPQRGERLLFFAGPYAESEGQPTPVERAIRFEERL
jgi:transglutaminase-like putative cysteine protease